MSPIAAGLQFDSASITAIATLTFQSYCAIRLLISSQLLRGCLVGSGAGSGACKGASTALTIGSGRCGSLLIVLTLRQVR